MFAGEDASIGRVWRLSQKAAQSSAPAEAAATWKRLAWLGRRVPADASAEPCQTSGSGGVGTTGATLGQPRARDRGAWEQL